jgi:hypothetical protein
MIVLVGESGLFVRFGKWLKGSEEKVTLRCHFSGVMINPRGFPNGAAGAAGRG